MRKAELISKVSDTTGHPIAVVEAVLSESIRTIINEVSKGGEVTLRGFGTFTVKRTKARVGHDFKTGGSINIDAKVQPQFKPSKYFKIEA
ncbi:HU family DNA-binding protein [Leadbetterella byssophila]|uniref:HU family DNA-binding protein n=1 Tax=Leadbetterella byssophila TaxID=316068 RepID=UPI0039A1AECC